MEPSVAFIAVSMAVAAPQPRLRDGSAVLAPSIPKNGKFELEARVLTGLDAGSGESPTSGEVSGALNLEAEAAYARRFSPKTYGLAELEIGMDLREGQTDASQLGLETAVELSSFLAGGARVREVEPRGGGIFPRLRVGVQVAYGLGMQLDGPEDQPPSSSLPGDIDDDLNDSPLDRDEESFSVPAFAFLEPFHEVAAGLHGVFEPRRSTRLEFSPRLVRTLRSADPGDRNRHFNELELEFEARERLNSIFRVGGAYRLELRRHDERVNDDDQALTYETQEAEVYVQLRWSPFRFRLRHRFRYRNVNASGRNAFRNTSELQARWRLDSALDLLLELATIHQHRIERSERDWSRNLAVAGVEVRY